MSPKMGQKLTDNPRNIRVGVRLTKSENEMLESCVRRTKSNKTDVIVKGIKKVNEELNKKEE